MAVREIRLYGDPVLREKAAEIEVVDDAVRALATDMLDTLQEAEGVGLAGPQPGIASFAIPPNSESKSNTLQSNPSHCS